MKNKVTIRQASMLVFLAVISMKFLLMPATMSKYADRDIYFAVFLGLAIDFVTLIIYLQTAKKYPNKTFYDIMSDHFGIIFTKVIYFLLAIIFFFKALFVIKATHAYFLDTLYDEFDWWLYVIPIIIFLAFVLKKNFRALGRTCEICILIIFVAIIICLILPIGNIELINVFPILNNGLEPVFSGWVRCSYGFGDYLIVLLLMGNIKKSANLNKIAYYAVLAIILITTFFFEFVALFGDMSTKQQLAISDISVHAQLPNTLGRIDWLIIFLWSVTLLLTCAILVFASKKCLDVVIGKKMISNVIVLISIFAMILLLYLNLALLIEIVTSIYYIVFSMTIYLGIPILLILCRVIDFARKPKGKVRYEVA